METTTNSPGSTARKLLLVCGLVMLITMPFVRTNIPLPTFYSVLFILTLAFLAGLTRTSRKLIIIADILISMIGFVVFTEQAVKSFNGFLNLLFATNLTLAILFISAFYWSVKGIRGVELSKLVIRKVVTKIKIKRERDVNVSEDAPMPAKKELTDEERRINRYLRQEE